MVARQLLDRGAKIGTVVLVDEQDSGRGRWGRRWVSPPGGLYASVLLPAEPLLPLRLGIAVVLALEKMGVPATLKWPNDVLVGERKIAGVLIDVVADVAIAGIGVNLSAVSVPGATSVGQESSCAIARDDLLDLILTCLPWDASERVLARYVTRCSTIGRIVRVESGRGPDEAVVGRAHGVDSSGRLLVDVGGSLHAVASGDCTHLVHETDNQEERDGLRVDELEREIE